MQPIKKNVPYIVFLTIISLISLIITIPYEFAIASTATDRKTVLILGDSLSAGYGIKQGKNWTDLLQRRLDQNNNAVKIVNASISGDTTANGLNRLSAAVEQFAPELIIIELGGNDGLRGLPIGHIMKNLDAMIQIGMASGAQIILMEISIPPNYGKKYTQAFSQIYPDLAEQYSVQLIPFILNDIALNPELMQTDGIHPNEKAQPEIMNKLWQAIESIQ